MTHARLNCDTKTLNASKMQKLWARSGTKSSSCSCFHTNEMMSPNCRKLFSISEQKWEKSTSARPHKHRTNTIRRSKDSTHSPRRRDWRAAQLELRDLRWETERERGREMTVCLWIKSSMLMQPALGCVLTNYQSCKSKKEQLILNIRSIFIFISAVVMRLKQKEWNWRFQSGLILSAKL